MPFDFNKLKGRIVEKYGTRRAFSRAMDMSPPALSARINGLIPFRADEITKACALLDVPNEEINDYFFNPKFE